MAPSQRGTSVRFTLSGPPSAASSRAASPAPTPPISSREGYLLEKTAQNEAGCLPMDVYDATLPAWRAAVRRVLVAQIRVESVLVAKMQTILSGGLILTWDLISVNFPLWRNFSERNLYRRAWDHFSASLQSGAAVVRIDAIRTPFLDNYFVYTSALGTHTFFMTFLPMLFFFGYPELGRGLIVVLCLGIYLTSVIKDLFCSPRPFAPPVTRLSLFFAVPSDAILTNATSAMGTHHLEYGMPSTHSANAVSLALFFWAYIHELAFPPPSTTPSLSVPAYAALTIGLAVYATSIVFGRLYTAMHSFSDCAVGVFFGGILWLAHTSFPGIPVSLTLPLPSALASALNLPGTYTYTTTLLRGWGAGELLDAWVLRTPSSLRVPFTLIPLALLAVNQHPQPVDDCPCFEDAIALGSVVLGMFIGRWGAVRWDAHVPGAGVVMPGSGWVLSADGWTEVEREWSDVGVWWAAAVAKMFFGIFVIFAWRLVAKAAMLRALPPTFRFLATLMRLPNRRFYTPATDYTSVPPVDALRPIPSVIDLPSAGVEVGGIGSGSGIGGVIVNGHGHGKGGLRRRAEAVEAARGGGAHVQESEAVPDDEGEGEVKHYDADVLTKLIVYAGIAVLACEVMPVLFEKFGWGVRSWP
ncbi:Sphingosine-1-phosphate phosphatase [Mycena sanguinolenta]|uniref:Sphingosine-1-phosphate phosphatase n=1 Tax=Mycena sanguinolenta TaxID=230812 RepID=A0A8H7CIK8_9AGAR|nr:Sphingosine-1-phosphate phosphatase [Mycena sanguinolenta]